MAYSGQVVVAKRECPAHYFDNQAKIFFQNTFEVHFGQT